MTVNKQDSRRERQKRLSKARLADARAQEGIVIDQVADVIAEESVSSEFIDLENLEGLILTHRDTGRKFGRTVLRRWGAQMGEDDFDSAVDLAICEAARSYCPQQGASFSTFLFYYVRGSLIKVIKSSVTAKKTVRAVRQSFLGNELSRSEKEADTSDEAPLKDLSIMAQQEYESPEERALRMEQVKILQDCMGRLGEDERNILVALFHEGATPNEMARRFGWSRQHIARIKNRAILQLKELFSEALGDSKPKKALVATMGKEERGVSRSRKKRLAARNFQIRKPIPVNHMRMAGVR